MIKKWELRESRIIFERRIFNILEKSYAKPDDSGEFTAYVMDVPDWANIIGINEEGNVLLIKQYRFGTDKVELEIPGGIIEPNETPMEGAIRELKEETGYDVKSIKQIGVVAGNPAIMNNDVYTFLARLGERGEVNFDPNEMIETMLVNPEQLETYLKEGKFSNAYCVIAFLWFKLANCY